MSVYVLTVNMPMTKALVCVLCADPTGAVGSCLACSNTEGEGSGFSAFCGALVCICPTSLGEGEVHMPSAVFKGSGVAC